MTSSILLFELEDLGLDSAEFIDWLAPSYLQLPYDIYDVWFAVEKTMAEGAPEIYRKHEQSWLEVWGADRS
ncbi:MAG: hypothetical protein AAGA65_30865, partial [Actinomycetota bacterium]